MRARKTKWSAREARQLLFGKEGFPQAGRGRGRGWGSGLVFCVKAFFDQQRAGVIGFLSKADQRRGGGAGLLVGGGIDRWDTYCCIGLGTAFRT